MKNKRQHLIDNIFQIKEIVFLKNTVMECEACGEFNTHTHTHTHTHFYFNIQCFDYNFVSLIFEFDDDGNCLVQVRPA